MGAPYFFGLLDIFFTLIKRRRDAAAQAKTASMIAPNCFSGISTENYSTVFFSDM